MMEPYLPGSAFAGLCLLILAATTLWRVAGVLASATSPRFADIYAARPSAALWPEARSRAELLVERLQAARGATDAIALLRAAIAAAADV